MEVVHTPRISKAGFCHVLELANSPAAPVAGDIYDMLIDEWGLDPAVALAFFQHESSYGQKGRAVLTRNWGNIRWVPVSERYADYNADDWAWFVRRPGERNAWEWYRSADAWGRLIKSVYGDKWGLHTVQGIIKKYAPYDDDNDPYGYSQTVMRQVNDWEKQYPLEQGGPTLEEVVEALGRVIEEHEARLVEIEDVLELGPPPAWEE